MSKTFNILNEAVSRMPRGAKITMEHRTGRAWLITVKVRVGNRYACVDQMVNGSDFELEAKLESLVRAINQEAHNHRLEHKGDQS